MPCGTCGGEGHNTRGCSVRKVAEFAGGQAGGAFGKNVGQSTHHPIIAGFIGEKIGERVGHEVTHRAMMTPSQQQYYKKHGHYA